jgi:CO/xanthine dehydrogenase Mo-binding subunit
MQSSIHGSTTNVIGQALNRVDGRAKVTGRATYAAEAPMDNMAYGVIVQSTIARSGRRAECSAKNACRSLT